MKPLSQLKSCRSATTPREILKNFLRITDNPKRHLRGPMYGVNPGTGKKDHGNSTEHINDAVCGCAIGLIRMIAKQDPHRPFVVESTVRMLDSAAYKLYPNRHGYVHVSDTLGLRAIRRVVNEALKNIS